MRLAVTGGAGFIGAHFINMEAARGEDEILCVDALTYAGNRTWIAPAEASRRVRFFHGNICDRDFIFSLFKKERPDAVVHFAAESHVDRSIAGPSVFLETNVMGTGTLLDACLACGISRFHQVSTDEVYGDLPLEGGDPFREGDPLHPSNPYAASKASADLLALAYRRTYGLYVTVSRCCNNYGPFQYAEKLIPLAVRRLLAGEAVPLYGDGCQVREWLYVKDHCRAVDDILRRGRDGEIYHVGSGEALTNREVVRRIARILGREGEIVRFTADRPGHDRRYALDTAKIEKELHWKPETGLAEGLAETVRFYEKYFTTGEVEYDL